MHSSEKKFTQIWYKLQKQRERDQLVEDKGKAVETGKEAKIEQDFSRR